YAQNRLEFNFWAWPFPSVDEQGPVVADLEHGRAVLIGGEGQLAHDPRCQGPHRISDQRLNLLILPRRWVNLRLTISAPPAFPRPHAIEPRISQESTPQFPHLLDEDDAACLLYPADHSWDARRGDSLSKFARLGMLWVFKAIVWLATRRGKPYGVWIGEDTS